MNKKNIVCLLGILFLSAAFSASGQAASSGSPSELAYLLSVTGTSFLPATISANDVVSLSVNVKNNGSSLYAVDLNGQLDVGNQFEPVKTSDSIAEISPGETKTLFFQFQVKSSTFAGYYPVFLTMNYTRNGTPVTQNETISVPVAITGKNIDVTIEPTVINPSSETQLVFSLKNLSNSPVSNISFSWSEPNSLILPLGSDNKRYVPVLNANETASLSYTVAADPNITTGIYPLNVSLSFVDSNGTRTQTSQVGLLVGGTTDFEVSADSYTAGQLSISIANVGSNNASAVVAKIASQPGITVTGSNTTILGNLNKGDFTIANFTVQLAGDQNRAGGGFNRPQQPSDQQPAAPRPSFSNSITIEIDYTDTTGKRQSTEKTIQLAPGFFQGTAGTIGTGTTGTGQFRQRTNSNGLVPWVLLVLVVGGAVALNRFRFKKDWKKLALPLAVVAIVFLAIIFLLQADLVYSIIAAVLSIGFLAWFFRKQNKEGKKP